MGGNIFDSFKLFECFRQGLSSLGFTVTIFVFQTCNVLPKLHSFRWQIICEKLIEVNPIHCLSLNQYITVVSCDLVAPKLILGFLLLSLQSFLGCHILIFCYFGNCSCLVCAVALFVSHLGNLSSLG